MWLVSYVTYVDKISQVSSTRQSISLFLDVPTLKFRIIINHFAAQPTRYNSPDCPYNKNLVAFTLPTISKNKGNQTKKFVQWIEYFILRNYRVGNIHDFRDQRILRTCRSCTIKLCQYKVAKVILSGKKAFKVAEVILFQELVDVEWWKMKILIIQKYIKFFILNSKPTNSNCNCLLTKICCANF